MVTAKKLLQEAKQRRERELQEKLLLLKEQNKKKEKLMKDPKNNDNNNNNLTPNNNNLTPNNNNLTPNNNNLTSNNNNLTFNNNNQLSNQNSNNNLSSNNSPTPARKKRRLSSNKLNIFVKRQSERDLLAEIDLFNRHLESSNIYNKILDTKLMKIKTEEVKKDLIEQEQEKLKKFEKIEKIEKIASERIENEQLLGEEIVEEEEEEEKVESNISKIVSESITKILICIIMGMIFIIPILDWGFWKDIELENYNSIANTLEQFKDIYNVIPAELNNTIKKYIETHYDKAFPILNITLGSDRFYVNETINYKHYRLEEVSSVFGKSHKANVNYLVVQKNQIEAIINLTKTLFICVILVISSFLFEGDANELVLRPLDVMTDIIHKVVNDPIGARNIDAMNIIQDVEKHNQIEEEKEEKKIELKDENDEKNEKDEKKEREIEELLEEHAEVQIIQKSIIKVSALLAIGFGEAGADIIRNNLKSNADLNPMMKGEKKSAFLGFCDIRGFLSVNEALKEDSVIFVNKIAEIVHKSVDKFGGATNKNIGDAFLNVWKFPDLNPHKEKYDISPNNIYSKVVGDKAVLSFLYVIRAIKITQDILDYSNDLRIQEAFPEEKYKVNMGFGLHYGWAIEGTVGSKFKIDASYLSPNVNIAARLEAASRQYGVTILISGTAYDFFSTEMKNICREIDRVTVKGSLKPIRLFTIDVNLDIPDENKIKKKKENLNVTEKIKKFLEKKLLYKNYYDKCESMLKLNFRTEFFLNNLEVIFEKKFKDSFYEKFSYGFEKYIEGKWYESVKYLKKCLLSVPNDGPSQILVNYMSEFKNIAPPKWKGYRELTSK